MDEILDLSKTEINNNIIISASPIGKTCFGLALVLETSLLFIITEINDKKYDDIRYTHEG